MILWNLTRQCCVADRVATADTSAARMRGLLGRSSLDPGEGLWIVPCESVHTFFMRFAIDLVYLDRDLRVRKIRSAVPPWRASVCWSAHSVVELASGAAAHSGLCKGDQLELLEN